MKLTWHRAWHNWICMQHVAGRQIAFSSWPENPTKKKKEAFWSILRAENCCEFFHKQLTWPRRMQLGKTRARHSRNSFMARSLKLIGLPEGGWQETGREGGRQRYVLHMKLRISANRWLPENVAAKVTTGDGKWHISVHAHTHTHTHTCDSFS